VSRSGQAAGSTPLTAWAKGKQTRDSKGSVSGGSIANELGLVTGGRSRRRHEVKSSSGCASDTEDLTEPIGCADGEVVNTRHDIMHTGAILNAATWTCAT